MESTLTNEKVAYIMKNIFIESTTKLNYNATRLCARAGIKAGELLEKSIDEIQGPRELQKMRWQAREVRRRRKLKLIWEMFKDYKHEENGQKQIDMESIQISLRKGKNVKDLETKLTFINRKSVDLGQVLALVTKARPKTTTCGGHSHEPKPSAPAPAHSHHHAPAPSHHHAPAPSHHHAPAPSHHHAPAPSHTAASTHHHTVNRATFQTDRKGSVASLFFSNTRQYAKSIQQNRLKMVQQNKKKVEKMSQERIESILERAKKKDKKTNENLKAYSQWRQIDNEKRKLHRNSNKNKYDTGVREQEKKSQEKYRSYYQKIKQKNQQKDFERRMISNRTFDQIQSKKDFELSPQARKLSAVNRFKLTRIMQVGQRSGNNSSASSRSLHPISLIKDFISSENEDIQQNLSLFESKKQRASIRKLNYSLQLSDNARRFSARAMSVQSNKNELDYDRNYNVLNKYIQNQKKMEKQKRLQMYIQEDKLEKKIEKMEQNRKQFEQIRKKEEQDRKEKNIQIKQKSKTSRELHLARIEAQKIQSMMSSELYRLKRLDILEQIRAQKTLNETKKSKIIYKHLHMKNNSVMAL